MKLALRLLRLTLGAAVLTHAVACGAPDEGELDEVASAPEDVGVDSDDLTGTVAVGAKLVTTIAVNFRAGAATTSTVLKVLPAGTTVTATGAAPQGVWYEVTFEGKRGFVHGTYLRSPAASTSRVQGLWVAHSSILTEEGIRQVVDTAKAAHINTLYPAVLRYSCAYFQTSAVPRCKDSRIDNLGILVATAKGAGIRVVPWVERIIQVRPGEGNDDKIERVKLNADFPVLDVSRQDVRSSILGAMVDAAKYEVSGIQVDDHLGYEGSRLTAAQKATYEAKLTNFASFLIREFKAQSGKRFELAPHPMPFARNAYLTNWPAWSGIDRVVIQCYRTSGNAIVNDGNCRTGRAGSGLGVATKANGVELSDAAIANVARTQVSRNEAFVLFHAGSLIERPSLVQALADALP
jgi:Bacterial SH3 domain